MAKTFYYIDREWFSKKDGIILGDMGFTFQDSAETVCEDFEEARSMVVDFAKEDMLQMGWDDDAIREEDDIPIYLVTRILVEDEDAEDMVVPYTTPYIEKEIMSIVVYANEEMVSEMCLQESGEVICLDPIQVLF